MSNHGGKTKRTAPTPKFIIQMLDPSITLTKYRKIEKDPALEHELRLLDDIATANKYKIGMLYAKSAEQSEEEMFCCGKHHYVDTSRCNKLIAEQRRDQVILINSKT